MKVIITAILTLIVCSLSAQLHTTVKIGEGTGTATGVGDSVGIVISTGELMIGTGTKAPTSTDSLLWNAGLYVEGPLYLTALPNLTESAGDSNLIINSSGTVFKSVLGANFFTSNGTANGSRVHDFDNFDLTISDIANFQITSNTNWSFNNTANDIKINAIDGLGMQIATSNAAEDLYLSSADDISITHTGDVLMNSTTGALILPRMTTTQRDALTPVAGMVIYNTTTATFQGYGTAGTWNDL